MASTPPVRNVDAGSLFVLESKGTWVNAGYHLTAATAGPPLLVLPFAVAGLGWGPGLFALCIAAAVTFYAYYLLSLIMEELEAQGKRSLRFWDLAAHVIGPRWAYYIVAPFQHIVCFITVVAIILIGGQTLQETIMEFSHNGKLRLYQFMIIFGASALVLSQLPSFHALRHFNLLSMLLCLGFSLCAIIGSVISGLSSKGPPKDYSVRGSPVNIMFGTFNSISIMITNFANPLVVETQATLAPPVKGKMLKGLLICYTVALSTFFSVSISGYWAFGNASQGVIFSNMKTLVPVWLYILGNAFACLQLIAATVLFLQPLFEKYEGLVADVNVERCSLRNVVPRFVGRSLFVAVAALLAAMLPFFADFSALIGAVGFMPLCIIFPLIFYTLFFRSKTNSWKLTYLVNYVIIGLTSVVVVLGSIASVRQIVLDVHTYTLFPNL